MAIQAKSVVFDFADNHGDASYLGIRSIDFYSGASKISLTTNFSAYSTSRFDSTFAADYAFNTSLAKTGADQYNSWISTSGGTTNQRLIIVFDSEQSFTSIVINNAHNSGASTTRGANNTVITYTLNTYTTTTYGATVTNGEVLWSGTLDEHIASDTEDEQTLDFSNKIEFSFSQLDFTCRGLVGEAVLAPTLPCLEPDIEGTFHTPGLITDLPSLDVSIEGSFVPNVVELEFDLPSLIFTGNITSNKIDVVTDLPVFSCAMFSGAQVNLNLPSLDFSGSVEATKSGNLNFTLPGLNGLLYSGSHVSEAIPSLGVSLNGTFTELVQTITSDLAFFIPSLEYLSSGDSSIGSILTTSLPELSCEMLSQEQQDQILRHIRGAVR